MVANKTIRAKSEVIREPVSEVDYQRFESFQSSWATKKAVNDDEGRPSLAAHRVSHQIPAKAGHKIGQGRKS
jgi:hypothetical protein